MPGLILHPVFSACSGFRRGLSVEKQMLNHPFPGVFLKIIFNFISRSYLLFLAGFIGVLFLASVNGIQMLFPTNINWLMHGDIGTHFMGWHFFRDEPWRFPIGKFLNYGWPAGSSIAFTDSIPVFAILFKLVSGLLPETFQYIGIWLYVCFFLQGVFSILLVRTMADDFLTRLISAAFFITSPILLIRTGHPALCSHWIIIAALWLYFRKEPYSLKSLRNWTMLAAISATIHPYITAMTIGLAAAFYLRVWLVDKKIFLKVLLMNFSVILCSVFILWWIIGYFEFGQIRNYGAEGYGDWSMNLAAPINPEVGIDIWPVSWSSIIKGIGFVSWTQCDGFAYLGIGVIILFIIALCVLAISPPDLKSLVFFLPLGLICLCFVVFAASNKITFGKLILFEFPLPQKLYNIFSIFHSSGRFFWPVYYTIFFIVLKSVIKKFNKNTAITVLAACLFFQISDSMAQYRYIHQTIKSINWENPLKNEFWGTLHGKYKHLVLVPPDHNKWQYLAFAYVAASQGMTVNSSYTARHDVVMDTLYTKKLLDEISKGKLSSDSVYVIDDEHINLINGFDSILIRKVDGFSVATLKN